MMLRIISEVLAPSLSIQCLSQTTDNVVSMVNPYIFNNIAYDSYDLIGLNTGIYTLTGVTSTHPFGFVINDNSLIQIISGNKLSNTKEVEGIEVTYYTGSIVFEVKGDFGTISYDCMNHGYMGGNKRLIYTTTCPINESEQPSA